MPSAPLLRAAEGSGGWPVAGGAPRPRPRQLPARGGPSSPHPCVLTDPRSAIPPWLPCHHPWVLRGLSPHVGSSRLRGGLVTLVLPTPPLSQPAQLCPHHCPGFLPSCPSSPGGPSLLRARYIQLSLPELLHHLPCHTPPFAPPSSFVYHPFCPCSSVPQRVPSFLLLLLHLQLHLFPLCALPLPTMSCPSLFCFCVTHPAHSCFPCPTPSTFLPSSCALPSSAMSHPSFPCFSITHPSRSSFPCSCHPVSHPSLPRSCYLCRPTCPSIPATSSSSLAPESSLTSYPFLSSAITHCLHPSFLCSCHPCTPSLPAMFLQHPACPIPRYGASPSPIASHSSFLCSSITHHVTSLLLMPLHHPMVHPSLPCFTTIRHIPSLVILIHLPPSPNLVFLRFHPVLSVLTCFTSSHCNLL